MSTIKVNDGTEIFYKDWGTGQPIVFHHGWPLSGDDWDAQMMYFLEKGYRVIAQDRRGHGRSSQTDKGHDMDTYAADVAELTKALDLKDAIHVGHSTGGGEVIRYAAKYGKGRVAKAVLISAVTPLMVKTDKNPDGIPMAIFDEIRLNTATRRQEYFQEFTIPFFGYNREGAKPSQGIRDNWWRQGMMGAIKAHYDCIKAFSETDFTEDLKSVDIPVLVMHGEDDQIVPFQLTAVNAVKLLKNGKLISYPGFPHGMPTTEAAKINEDLLSFIKVGKAVNVEPALN
jgi:non-heme chloroperoxidase